MGCPACEAFTQEDNQFPYRWKHATVAIIACAEHAKEIMEALNAVQDTRRTHERGYPTSGV